MSYDWTPVCDTCGKDGPKFRSGQLGLTFGPGHETSTMTLQQWLEHHEHHLVRLRGEGTQLGDGWDPRGAADIRLSVEPGTRQIIGNSSNRPLVIRAGADKNLKNCFVLPEGVDEVVVPPHGSAVFVAETPSLWQHLRCRLAGRVPALRWRYQPWDQDP